ncbi:MAG TPA: periplasmic heavy metal sensor [Candidatus Tectomicrobia bacterium]
MRLRAVLHSGEVCLNMTAILGVSVFLLLGGMAAFAQAPASAPPAQHAMTDAADQHKPLADQITELRAQVARLQAAVAQTGPGKKATSTSGLKMSPASNKGLGMMDDKEEMSGMPMGSSSNTSPAPAPAMGMCCMGKIASGGNAAMSAMPPAADGMATMRGPASATPGQIGASHLYHIGSNGFFLNHARHITLTPDQALSLNQLKEKAMLDRASEQRRIDQAEQELYTLTGADQPDDASIQAKIVEIEQLRAAQRMHFIRAVADANNVLTPAQRQALLGTMAATQK